MTAPAPGGGVPSREMCTEPAVGVWVSGEEVAAGEVASAEGDEGGAAVAAGEVAGAEGDEGGTAVAADDGAAEAVR